MIDVVVFDVDKTIIDGQSQKLFLQYLLRNHHISLIFYLKIYLWFFLYACGLVNSPKHVMEYAYSFLKNRSAYDIESLSASFCDSILYSKIYPKAVQIVREHRQRGNRVILMSNAPDIIVSRVAKFLDVHEFVCTTLEKYDGKYSGRISDAVYGTNKVAALKNYLEAQRIEYKSLWAYGDHSSDRDLLKFSNQPFAVNPSIYLRLIAKYYNWPIISFKPIP